MVVYYFHVPSIFSIPSKAYSPLVVDADTVLTSPVSRKGFQAVTGGFLKSIRFSELSKSRSFSKARFCTDSENFLTGLS